MSSFLVNACLDTTQHAGYQWHKRPSIDCLMSPALDSCLYHTVSFINVHRFSIALFFLYIFAGDIGLYL